MEVSIALNLITIIMLVIAGVINFIVFYYLTIKINSIMAFTKEQFDVLRDQINAATNKIAEKIADLTEQLKAGGLTPDEEAAIFADFEAVVATLEGIAADPENPVPDPVTPE